MALENLTKITSVGISSHISLTGVTTVGFITSTDAWVGGALTLGGNITAVDGTFSGDVSIGGTVTYEDVTNIDSVGIVTAQNGLRVTAGGLNVTGVSTFGGAIDANGALDVDGQTDLDVLNVAETATFSSLVDVNNRIDVVGGANVDQVNVTGVSTFAGYINLAQKIIHTGDADTSIEFDTNTIKFETAGSERLNIASNGDVTITNTSSNPQLALISANDGISEIQFGDGNDAVRGNILYRSGSAGDALCFNGYNNTERLRISSDGHIFVANEAGTIDTTARLGEGHRLQLSGLSSNDGISVVRYNASYGVWGINLGRSKSGTLGTNTILTDNDDIGHITFWGADGSDFNKAAQISAEVDGTPSDGTDMPGALVLKTSAEASGTPTERLRITSAGDLKLNQSQSKINLNTTDGSDNKFLSINGGGDASQSRGAGITWYGNEVGSHEGRLQILAGNSGSTNGVIQFHTGGTERLRITSDGVIQTPGTTKIKTHSVGIGTNSSTPTGVGTAYGEMMYNSTTNNVQVYTTTNLWYNVSDLQGYYKTAAAASSDGMNHYWGGSSSTSIISGLTPSGSPDGSPNTPTVGHTAQSYYGDYPYFDFSNGNDQVGYRFTKSGTKWGAGPFTICFWVDVQGVTMESESTYVQLGSHSGLRSLYTVSVDADRKLKAITIGDDTGVSSDAQLIGNTWQHVAVTYNTSLVTKYYMNGSLVRSHTHNSALDVGTSTQYIYLGYGYWNSSAGNKAAMAHMSDIGIWDAKELNATEIKNIYNAKRIIRAY